MSAIGLLHPGAMGAAVGAVLVGAGHDVRWVGAGRSEATAARARAARLVDAGDLAGLLATSEVVLSICPPHAALEVARSVAGFEGVFVDANAVAPQTAGAIAEVVGPRSVDGGIVGPPPIRAGTTRLYLSGEGAPAIAALFADTVLDPVVLAEGGPVAASALKMAYAAWTKGSAALLLAVEEAARRLGVGEALATEWAISQPQLAQRLAAARAAAGAKGWRWIAEMEEIASTLDAAGQPDGFHRAAAEVYRARS